ncbi:hypothetical protein WN51_03161 [Melipona quadrifasciata]|uniref:Uncharacterized protein n=1 Tax=Melipona quadrifasciata TaxID=166423 RepID=A0A0M8ZY70_9HYME|nr:hypothetical protein WN51_03161 [Melipona quadrifasciata]
MKNGTKGKTSTYVSVDIRNSHRLSSSSSSVCSSGDKRRQPATHGDERASVTRSRGIERSVCSWLQV